MATKISDLTSVSSLDGSELIEVVQSGANKKATTNGIVGALSSAQNKCLKYENTTLELAIKANYASSPRSAMGGFMFYNCTGMPTITSGACLYWYEYVGSTDAIVMAIDYDTGAIETTHIRMR